MIQMMTLIVSHRIERLIDSIAERLSVDSILGERWIVLPSLIQQQWLMVQLVERMPRQAIAGVRCLGWREALRRICSHSHIPDLMEFKIRLDRILSGEISREAQATLEPLLRWLKPGQRSRKNALIRSLSVQLMEASFYGVHVSKPWQIALHELLANDHSWEWLFQALEGASWPSTVCQMHCFCTDEMPSTGWDFLVSHAPDLYIYQFSPCCMFWDDTLTHSQRRYVTKRWKEENISSASLEIMDDYLRDTHPLLANWGRLGRESMRQLDKYAMPTIEAYEEPSPTQPTLLQTVQQDVLLLRTAKDVIYQRDRTDTSIQIVAAGMSRMQEVQVLKDNVCRWIDQSKGSFSDVLVLAPDIQAYEPVIQFVFGPDIPIRIAPISSLESYSFLQGMLLLFNLPDRQWEVDAVLELFENAAFQSKHQMLTDDLEWFRLWLQEANVRGGLTKNRGNWSEGLQRMVRGLTYLLPEEEPFVGIRSIDWGQVERLDQFIRIMDQLQTQHATWQKQNYTLEKWVALLSSAANQLFQVHEKEEDFWKAFLRKIAMQPFSSEFSFATIKMLFEDECQSITSAFQPLSVDSIQFSSLDGGVRPARAIFILGLDDESFPHLESHSTLNWDHETVSRPDRDRYLLLQALFAARDYFCISYCHLSGRDGKGVDPALPVQELMQVIETYYPAEKKLEISHPALPVASFQKKPNEHRLPSCPANAPTQWNLSDLTLLARHPWKYFLQRRLGIYLKKEKLFSSYREEDFVLAPYQEQHFLKQTFRKPIETVLIDDHHRLPPGALGEWTSAQLTKKAAQWESRLKKWGISKEGIFSIHFMKECNALCRVSSDRWMAPPIVITTEKGPIEIVGTVEEASELGLLISDEPNRAGYLRHWPAFLAYLTVFPTHSSIYSLKKGSQKNWNVPDPHQAWNRWIQYATRAHNSLSPLISPWVDALLDQDQERFKQEVQRSILNEDDRTIRWVLERFDPFPIEPIWRDWSDFLKQTFIDWVAEKEDATI